MYLPTKKGLKCKHQLDKKNDADKTNNSHAQGVLSIGIYMDGKVLSYYNSYRYCLSIRYCNGILIGTLDI